MALGSRKIGRVRQGAEKRRARVYSSKGREEREEAVGRDRILAKHTGRGRESFPH